MFSRKLVGTLTVIAATAAVPGFAAARGADPDPAPPRSFYIDETGILLAATPVPAAGRSSDKAITSHAGGEVISDFFDIPAELASLRSSAAPPATLALQEATQMQSRRYARGARARGRRVQYRGRVRVGADGNGVTAATFPTTLAGDDVRYLLLVQNGCRTPSPTEPCPPGVEDLQVTLDDEVVLDEAGLKSARHDIALNAVRGGENRILITATGTPRAAARIRILALRTPQRVQYRGRVTVGDDGNGVTAATFATTHAGDDVRYELVVDTDCNPIGPCRPAARELDVSLNEELVLHTTDLDTENRQQITLNPPDTDTNRILITAKGSPRAGARIQVVAVRRTGTEDCDSVDPNDRAGVPGPRRRGVA